MLKILVFVFLDAVYFYFLVLECCLLSAILQITNSWLVEMKEHCSPWPSFLRISTSFHHTISSHHFGQEEGQTILSRSIIQRWFTSPFYLQPLMHSRIQSWKRWYLPPGSFLGWLSPPASLHPQIQVTLTTNPSVFVSGYHISPP